MNINVNQNKKLYTHITISSLMGQEVELLTVGASLTKWITKKGINIVASYKNPLDYYKPGMYLGTTVGLNSGRIEDSKFYLDNKLYQIKSANSEFLHGGDNSLSFQNFDYSIEINTDELVIISFSLVYQPGYLPGIQKVIVKYIIRDGQIRITFDVTSDTLTLCNLTNHSYFNLDGEFNDTVKNHSLQLPSSRVVLINKNFIGKEILDVKDTFYDFTTLSLVLPKVEAIRKSGDPAFGLDHYFPFDGGKQLAPIRLYSNKTKLLLEVFSSYPGVTVYSSNFPNEKLLHNNRKLALSGAICLETQYASNAINDSRFEKGIIDLNHPYHHFIEYTIGGTI
ncbi:MAG: hypothetical protein PHC62_03585 [Candidatus Izemoplasmatales bacterium]|jgi:aldose 1-epimerase|nr:hypothetical protein [Candidatus Izemoplasmatales bacterium]